VTLSVRFTVEGKHLKGILQVVSRTGGCVRLDRALRPGTLLEVVLESGSGPVTALVEFLAARPHGRFFVQPFRFVAFSDEDFARFDSSLQNMRHAPRAN
jgi:ABC-type phosphonate transport system ATPase subunit